VKNKNKKLRFYSTLLTKRWKFVLKRGGAAKIISFRDIGQKPKPLKKLKKLFQIFENMACLQVEKYTCVYEKCFQALAQ